MSESNDQEAEVGRGYLSSHPFLSDAVGIVGAEAMAGINAAVGAVQQSSSHLVSPCFDPRAIHQ